MSSSQIDITQIGPSKISDQNASSKKISTTDADSTSNHTQNAASSTSDSIPSVSISGQPAPQFKQSEPSQDQGQSQSTGELIALSTRTEPIPGCSHLSNLSNDVLDKMLLRYRSGLRWGKKTRLGQVLEIGKSEEEGGDEDQPPGKRRKVSTIGRVVHESRRNLRLLQ